MMLRAWRGHAVALLVVGLGLAAGGLPHTVVQGAGPVAPTTAVEVDREALRGNWRIIELHVDGQRSADEEARRLTVVNGGDGSWTLLRDGAEFIRGTSTIDPAATPKAIDFTATDPDGERQEYQGIYEPGDPIRRICFGRPGRPRPVAFTSTPDDEQLLIVFQRE